jgi:hypothetical protein
MKHSTIIQGKEFTYLNGDLILNDGEIITKNDMQEISKQYLGANRIHKPMALLFWIDCNNNNQNNWK